MIHVDMYLSVRFPFDSKPSNNNRLTKISVLLCVNYHRNCMFMFDEELQFYVRLLHMRMYRDVTGNRKTILHDVLLNTEA